MQIFEKKSWAYDVLERCEQKIESKKVHITF